MDRHQSNLVWIDLEMTGLNPDTETIIEIATIVTTNNLDFVAEGPNLAIATDEKFLTGMDEWNTTHHTRSGLVDKVRNSSTTLAQAENMTLMFLAQFTQKGLSPLCGNSVWQDRHFLRKQMPALDEFLNYRIIDVSSVKEAVRRWFPNNPHTFFAKTQNHRALEDILQSVEELKHYRTFFFCEKE